MSASHPSDILPLGTSNSLPASCDPMRTASDRGSSPFLTISITMGMVVSTPGIPDGAAPNSCSFSATV